MFKRNDRLFERSYRNAVIPNFSWRFKKTRSVANCLGLSHGNRSYRPCLPYRRCLEATPSGAAAQPQAVQQRLGPGHVQRDFGCSGARRVRQRHNASGARRKVQRRTRRGAHRTAARATSVTAESGCVRVGAKTGGCRCGCAQSAGVHNSGHSSHA